MSSAVEKGLKFEEAVVKQLKECGLTAFRTNKTNPNDPKGFKHGFDGGVDIIAKFKHPDYTLKEYVFYIQCKCQKSDLTKSAIAEVYAGKDARLGFGNTAIPVVIATCNVTEETRYYANLLNVELILTEEIRTLRQAKITHEATYNNYGNLMKVLLYHYAGKKEFINTLPDISSYAINRAFPKELEAYQKADFDKMEALNSSIEDLQNKLMEKK